MAPTNTPASSAPLMPLELQAYQSCVETCVFAKTSMHKFRRNCKGMESEGVHEGAAYRFGANTGSVAFIALPI